MKKLKPCPFCGGNAVMEKIRRSDMLKKYPDKAEVLATYPFSWWRMGCDTPDCILYFDTGNGTVRLGFHATAKKQAIERWNRRPKKGKLQKECKK